MNSWFSSKYGISGSVEDVYSKLLLFVNEATKIKIRRSSYNEKNIIIEGKTGIQWLQNSYPTHLKITGVLIDKDLLEISVEIPGNQNVDRKLYIKLDQYIKNNFKIENIRYNKVMNYLEKSNIYPEGLISSYSEKEISSLKTLVRQKIEDRSIYIKEGKNLLFPSYINELSIYELNKILNELEIFDYGFVDVTRTSREDIIIGNYIYCIDKNKTITLLRNPLSFYIDRNEDPYFVFDANNYQDAINKINRFEEKSIKDFQLFGTELMINRVETIDNKELRGTIDNPRILGTAIRELLFGQSYAILSGMNKMMEQMNQTLISNKVNIKTISEIKDTRVVQVIFDDNTDIELKGIAIYYDFNRKMGNIKNKQVNEEGTKQSTVLHDQSKNDNLSRLRQYKQMLEEGLIDEEDFKELKRKLLQF